MRLAFADGVASETASRIMCRNVTRSHVILFAQTLFWFDFF